MVKSCNETPSPRRLLLNLLDVAEDGVLTAGQAVTAGAIFGLSATHVRVTLTRLTQARLVEAAGRGTYRLGKASRTIGREVAGWREADRGVRPWSGAWCACVLAPGAGRDRSKARTTARALAIGGLRPLAPGLFVRPDNLPGGSPGLRERLMRIGLDEAAIVATLTDLDATRAERVLSLWDGAALSAGYRAATERMRDWLASADGLAPDVAARESFLLGDAAIRQILFDPMLPAPLVDEAARAEMIATTMTFDDHGRRIWLDLLSQPSLQDDPAGSPKR